MAPAELKRVLAAHALWVETGGKEGTRADLTRANLSDAYLSGTNLSGAAGIIDAGQDPRGYRFVGVQHADGWLAAAGCRWFTIPEARAHWVNNPDALLRVAVIENGGAR